MKQALPTLVALLVMGALLVAYQRQTAGEKPDPDQGDILLELDRESLKGIEITNGHGRLALEKREGKWTLTQPVEDAVEPGRLDALLGRLAMLQALRRVELDGQPLDPAAYGLDKPVSSVTWRTTNGGGRLSVGQLSKVDASRYVELEGDRTLWMCANDSLAPFLEEPRVYRDPTVLVFDPQQVVRFEITGRTESVLLLRTGEGESASWTLQSPRESQPMKADAMQVVNTLGALAALKAETFVDEANGKTDDGLHHVTLESKEGKLLEFITRAVPEDRDRLHVKRPDRPDRPWLYAVPRASLQDLDLGVPGWRDKKVFALDPAAVTRVTVRTPERTVAASKATTSWSFDPVLYEADATNIAGALATTVAQLHARRYLPATTSVTATAWATVELDAVSPVTVSLHTGPEGEAVVRTPGLPDLAPMQDLGQVVRNFLSWQRRLATLDPTRVTEVTLRRGEKSRVLRRDASLAWKLEGEPDRPVNEIVLALLDAVMKLEATETLDPSADREALGLGPAADRFTFTGATPQPLVLILGKVEGELRAIEVDGAGRVARVRSPELAAAIQKLESPPAASAGP